VSVFTLIRSGILRSATVPGFAAARLMEEVLLMRAYNQAAQGQRDEGFARGASGVGMQDGAPQ
jgi:hypothetical protein